MVTTKKINIYSLAGGQGVKTVKVACENLALLQGYIDEKGVKFKSISIDEEIDLVMDQGPDLYVLKSNSSLSKSLQDSPATPARAEMAKESAKVNKLHEIDGTLIMPSGPTAEHDYFDRKDREITQSVPMYKPPGYDNDNGYPLPAKKGKKK